MSIEDQPIQCTTCQELVIAEYDTVLGEITVYEFEPYSSKQQKVLHPHRAGPLMKRRVMSRVAVEKRLLHSFDEGDFHILTNKRRINY